MIMFSKFVLGEYTKFLSCLTAILFFAADCSADNTPQEIAKVVEKKVATEKQESLTETNKSSPKNKNVISEFIESISNAKISNIKKPFKNLPGYWQQINEFDITITNTEINDEFPSEKFSIKNLKGNVVVVFFTTTWCPNCIKVFQDLDSLSRELSNKSISNVKIVPLVLGMDDDTAIKAYYEENKVKSLHRFKSLSPLFFNTIRAVPTCLIFNKKSVPVWGFSGAANYGDPSFLNFIENLSNEK